MPHLITELSVGDIDLDHGSYDNLGPICDITTHSIAAGAMRLLRHRGSGKLFAGKFISRPEVRQIQLLGFPTATLLPLCFSHLVTNLCRL